MPEGSEKLYNWKSVQTVTGGMRHYEGSREKRPLLRPATYILRGTSAEGSRYGKRSFPKSRGQRGDEWEAWALNISFAESLRDLVKFHPEEKGEEETHEDELSNQGVKFWGGNGTGKGWARGGHNISGRKTL